VRALAADIGGTSLRAALVDANGKILDRRSGPTPPDPAAGLALLRRFWDELGAADARGVVIAGGIRPGSGEITQSPNLPRWEGVPLARELACGAWNDANGALLGEAWKGALRGARSALLLTLGTGVGGGVLLDGALWEGATGCAGELGHVPVEGRGPPCACGSRGCLEVYASAPAVARAAGAPDGVEAARLARAGDAKAAAAFAGAGEALGIALAGLVNAFNPEAICLGGGLAGAFDLLAPPLEATLAARAFRLAREGLRIVPAALGNDAGLLGAAGAALQSKGKE